MYAWKGRTFLWKCEEVGLGAEGRGAVFFPKDLTLKKSIVLITIQTKFMQVNLITTFL